ncbi:MAG TPA: DUF6044 family protein [Methylomusa anaerophila]|uniref:Bacterial membrane protein YfhO n=1 Tax=Methylomusa anaerophila TaxID=1930071 RepID=A0A348AJH3_9FIRM|nr:DUF6044 family protein [Methylomusa anaerophila]BBB91221.1 hypothetical protein MAMMFC1_01892 [Methylomusa anaerophila]HML89784.1 DUF6044 family protein [Methylomusa anaerophila]
MPIVEKLHRWRINFPFLLTSSLFILYLLPFLLLRQNAHFPINDNLDWLTGWTTLAHSGKAFSLNGTIDQIMNGVPRSCLPSGLNVITWLYMLFHPFHAYLLNLILVHTAALAGMYLLLKNYIVPADTPWKSSIVWGTALCFAILPFYSVYGWSIAGQPLLAYAFYNAYYNRKMVFNSLIILIYALYSSLPLTGVFILAALTLIAVIDYGKTRQLKINFLIAIVLLAACYTVTEIGLIYNTFIAPGFLSSRVEIDRILLGQSKDLAGVRDLIADNFINGQYHAVSLHQFILAAAVPLGLTAGIIRRDKLSARLAALLIIILAISVFYGFRYWQIFMAFTAKINILNAFQIQRFHWFHPLLWNVVLAVALAIIVKLRYAGKPLLTLLLALQMAYLFGNNIEYNLWLKEKAGIETNVMANAWLYENITYGQFFSDKLFKQVDAYIGRPKQEYRIVSIGLYPAIPQYHGFYTLDGRLNIYPLEYKHQFRQVIAKELNKNPFWQNYFDHWGITCYVFPAELNYLQVRKGYQLKLKNLELDTRALKALGGEYIFSAAEIINYRANNLEFLTKITDEWSPWEIYLYKVL